MPTIADYVVLIDQSFTLGEPGTISDRHFQFDAPGVSSTNRSIVTFNVDPNIAAGNVTLRMRLNNALAPTIEFGTNPTRSLHEVFPAGTVKVTGNELVVSVPADSGGGSIAVSDIVVFFQAII
jgi:hypothetical protein